MDIDAAIQHLDEAYEVLLQASAMYMRALTLVNCLPPPALVSYALAHTHGRILPNPPQTVEGRKRWETSVRHARARRLQKKDGRSVAVAAGLQALLNAGGLARMDDAAARNA